MKMEDKQIEALIDKFIETKKVENKKEEEGIVCPNCGSTSVTKKDGAYTCDECDYTGGIDQFTSGKTDSKKESDSKNDGE